MQICKVTGKYTIQPILRIKFPIIHYLPTFKWINSFLVIKLLAVVSRKFLWKSATAYGLYTAMQLS